MVKGLIINKFRGDKTILDPGVEMIEKLCKIPVVGVVPYMDVDIEDEDSLSSRLSSTGRNNTLKQENESSEKHIEAWIDIAAIRFPRLSNFTDLNVFDPIPGVSVRYVSRLSELGRPDLIVLPGTKNTIEDLLWMRQNGLEAAVLKKAAGGTPIWGICGGYQMMDRRCQIRKEPRRVCLGVRSPVWDFCRYRHSFRKKRPGRRSRDVSGRSAVSFPGFRGWRRKDMKYIWERHHLSAVILLRT